MPEWFYCPASFHVSFTHCAHTRFSKLFNHMLVFTEKGEKLFSPTLNTGNCFSVSLSNFILANEYMIWKIEGSSFYYCSKKDYFLPSLNNCTFLNTCHFTPYCPGNIASLRFWVFTLSLFSQNCEQRLERKSCALKHTGLKREPSSTT